MVANKCNTCFYGQRSGSGFPCVVCEGYNKYVNANVFQPDTVQISTWDEDDAFDAYDKEQYVKQTDAVNSPKHYMLFPDKGIEVRDVLIALAEKIKKEAKKDDYPQPYSKPMFEADYVQMMQYGMRFMEKNGLEDLKKMRWFLDKCIDAYERNYT